MAAWGQSSKVRVDWAQLEAVAVARYADQGRARIQPWRSLLNELKGEPVDLQLREVNGFFNASVRWTTDQALFGQSDYWATPLETMALEAGDCEDFSIAKYVTLLSLGVDPGDLRLVYVKANRPGLAPQAHMILAWYATPDAVPLILDNLNPNVLPANERPDLLPIFSFNHVDLWLGTSATRSGRDPRARMARWQQVLGKMQTEGMTVID